MLKSIRIFFFQAEDGIRDLTVTGVQTCALPISDRVVRETVTEIVSKTAERLVQDEIEKIKLAGERSEERRVGKECAKGCSQDHDEHNKNNPAYIRPLDKYNNDVVDKKKNTTVRA